MECKLSELVKLGHDQSAELKASCGAVDVRDVAQLISDLATQLDVQLARSNALAAELRAVEAIHNEAVFITDEHYEQCPPEVQKMIRSLAVLQIPAYQAFLAEVRAQESKRVYESILDNPAVTDMESLVDWLEQYASDSVAFAAQLRKGVQP